MQKVVTEWFVTGLGMAVWGVPFIGFLFWLSKNYLTSYSSKKGENLATKEDIREITKEVEAAKEDFSHRLENLKTHNSLAMVAAEKRLNAHQELFNYARTIHLYVHGVPREDIVILIDEAEDWLYKNIVYLDGEVRETFLSAILYIYNSTNNKKTFLEDEELDLADEKIKSAQDNILKAVELPAMSAMSFKNMAKDRASPV